MVKLVSNPYDNAKAQSFFKTFKQEEVYLKEYELFADAEANLQDFIARVYNIRRLTASLVCATVQPCSQCLSNGPLISGGERHAARR